MGEAEAEEALLKLDVRRAVVVVADGSVMASCEMAEAPEVVGASDRKTMGLLRSMWRTSRVLKVTADIVSVVWW